MNIYDATETAYKNGYAQGVKDAQKQKAQKEMDLKDTVAGMLSDDWEERLRAEYHQVKIRHAKLLKVCCREEGTLKVEMMRHQERIMRHQEWIMREYMRCLEFRADIAGVKL